jgi:hypothetical protein
VLEHTKLVGTRGGSGSQPREMRGQRKEGEGERKAAGASMVVGADERSRE